MISFENCREILGLGGPFVGELFINQKLLLKNIVMFLGGEGGSLYGILMHILKI